MAGSRGRTGGCVARRGPRLPRRSCATHLLTLRSKFPPQNDSQADDCSACLSKNPDFMRLSRRLCCIRAAEREPHALALSAAPTLKRSSRNLRRGNRGPRRAYTTASSAAALGHLGAADKRGSGAKTARNRCTECLRRAVSMIRRRALDWRCRKPIGAPPGCARSRRHALPALLRSLAGCPA
jgi:hypothetical protein